jgi:hypothetical protein
MLSNTSTTSLEHDVNASTIVTLKKGGQNV